MGAGTALLESWLCLLAILLLNSKFALTEEIIYAINAGGEAHTDVNGIRYERDPLHGKIGTASDYGKQLRIVRVPQSDQVLYQTERYHLNTFGYTVPIHEDGQYVLVMKFCEVYFNSPALKVFDIVLNEAITVITELDIFEKVGRGVAHDEYVPFTIENGRLQVDDEEVEFHGKLKIDFIKGSKDNPKINAMYIMKGTIDKVPKLSEIPKEIEDDDDVFKGDQEEKLSSPSKNRNPSGPRIADPYTSDESSTMLPIFIAIGAFIPIVFCLCKL